MGELTIRPVTVVINAIVLDGKCLPIAAYDQMPIRELYAIGDEMETCTPLWTVRRCPSTCIADQRAAERFKRQGDMDLYHDYRVPSHVHVIARTEDDTPAVFMVPRSFTVAAEFVSYENPDDKAEDIVRYSTWLNAPQGYIGVGR